MELDKFYNVRGNIKREEKLKKLGIISDNFIVGNMGRLEEIKGHKFLFNAFKKVTEQRKEYQP